MTFRISDTFSDSLSKLTAQEQKSVKTAAFDLQMNPSNPGLSMHRVDRARDPDFWTARVNRDIRLVLHKRKGDTLLAFVAHHDDAYRWAETRRIDTHPRTGAIQIVEARETIEEVVVQRYVEEAVKMPRLFADENDDTLLSWGVPEDWLETVREATEDTVLDIAGHLPAEAAEALVQAATGVRPEPAPVIGADVDPWMHPDTARRFRVMDNVEELKEALEAPWEKWSVFLHPAQREFVERDFNGPARVIGSAGTGKTVVALHRAARLAQNEGSKVLLTTFNQTLADRLAEKVPFVAHREAANRIEIEALGALIQRLHNEQFGASRIADETAVRETLNSAATELGLSVDPEFLHDEWTLIVDAWDVVDAEAYRSLPRLGRKTRMAASRRDELWAVFEAARKKLAESGLKTAAQLAHELRKGDRFPFSNVLVDEAQDISTGELLLLGARLGDQPNGLFFAGDIGQRIFRAPFPWSAAGIELRGRSRSLKVNYRTSHQIRIQTENLLPETLIEADGSEESRLGVTSVFEGPVPEMHIFQDREEELRALHLWIEKLKTSGVDPSEIAVLFRHPDFSQNILGSVPTKSFVLPTACDSFLAKQAVGVVTWRDQT